jgi:hypothetical protein
VPRRPARAYGYGIQNVIVRGLGLESVWLPVGIMLLYALVFFALAVCRFRFE